MQLPFSNKIMNTNQKFPGNGSPVPVLAVIGLGVALLNWLLSDDKAEESETATANAGTEKNRKVAETPPKTPAFRPVPAENPVKPAVVLAVIPPLSVTPVPKVFAPVPAPPKIAAQIPPPPIKKRFVTRADLATVFHNGALGLTRTAAVAALKSLGFGKTAAYAALSPDGRFAAWLQFAPDGMISWTD
jgi:hypothetical protein